MDCKLHQRLCDVPTIQKLNAQTQNTNLSHPSTILACPIQTSCLRPHHRIAKEQRLRCNLNHSGPRMFESSGFPPLQDHHYRTPNRVPIPPSRVLLVWTPTQNHQRPRPPLHISLWTSASQRAGNPTKHFDRLSPTNRWSHRANESMGRAVLMINNRKPRGLEQLASYRNHSLQ